MKKSYHAAFVFGPTGVNERPERMEMGGAGSMTSGAPRVIDPTRFARERSRVSGTLTLAQLPRVADLLIDREGTVRYLVEGGTSAKGQPLLRLSLTADLAVACQRCLEALPMHLDVTRDLVLAASVSDLDPLEDEDDDMDVITGTAQLDLYDLVEQEILLSVPIAPRHPDAACSTQSQEPKMGEAASPFSALAALKRQPK